MITKTFAKVLVLAPALALAVPAVAHAEDATTFERAGVTYTYTSKVEKGATILSGKADSRAFRLVIKNGRVVGHFDSQPVSFTTAEAKSNALAMR